MTTLAQLLDRKSSSPFSTDSKQLKMETGEGDLQDTDNQNLEEIELVYKTPKGNSPSLSRTRQLHKIINKIANSAASEKVNLEPSCTGRISDALQDVTIPGSRLSLIATSVPQPKMVNVSQLINSKKVKKPLPALSPIGSNIHKVAKFQHIFNSDAITITPVDCHQSTTPKSVKSASIPRRQLAMGRRSTDYSSSPSSNSGCSTNGEFPISSYMHNDGERALDDRSRNLKMVKKKDTNKIKRPLNAFMVWSKQQRRKIMDCDPTVHHSLISKQLGALWKNLTEEERLPYYEEAKRLSELHNQIYPDYKYRPKRKDRMRSSNYASYSDTIQGNDSQSPSPPDIRTKTINITINSEKYKPRMQTNIPSIYTTAEENLRMDAMDGLLDLSMKPRRNDVSGKSNSESSILRQYVSTGDIGEASDDHWKTSFVESESDDDRLVIDE